MPSMTPMISDMRPAPCSIDSTEPTAWPITTTPASMALRTCKVWCSAACAASVLFCTTAVTCSTLATVWATLVACSSVRSASAWWSWYRVWPACATRAALLRMSATMLDSATTMASSCCPICASSSWPDRLRRTVRSPCVVLCMASDNCCTDGSTLRCNAPKKYSCTSSASTTHSSAQRSGKPQPTQAQDNVHTAPSQATKANLADKRQGLSTQRAGFHNSTHLLLEVCKNL